MNDNPAEADINPALTHHIIAPSPSLPTPRISTASTTRSCPTCGSSYTRELERARNQHTQYLRTHFPDNNAEVFRTYERITSCATTTTGLSALDAAFILAIRYAGPSMSLEVLQDYYIAEFEGNVGRRMRLEVWDMVEEIKSRDDLDGIQTCLNDLFN